MTTIVTIHIVIHGININTHLPSLLTYIINIIHIMYIINMITNICIIILLFWHRPCMTKVYRDKQEIRPLVSIQERRAAVVPTIK